MQPGTRGTSEALTVPYDLTEWSDPARLRQWVSEAVEGLNWENPELVSHLKTHPHYQPRAWLTFLTYAYASGVFETDEIVLACLRDPNFRSLSDQEAPEAQSLVRFRRDNRGLLKYTLVEVLKRAVADRFGVAPESLPPGVRRHLLDLAVIRLDTARHMDRNTAEA